jgi:hypothetical protein
VALFPTVCYTAALSLFADSPQPAAGCTLEPALMATFNPAQHSHQLSSLRAQLAGPGRATSPIESFSFGNKQEDEVRAAGATFRRFSNTVFACSLYFFCAVSLNVVLCLTLCCLICFCWPAQRILPCSSRTPPTSCCVPVSAAA